jgi:hypothetical protein
MYLYTMSSRLINVRLDDAYLRKARKLRERGIVLSQLVRDAIDAKFDALIPEAPRHPSEIVERLFEQYPDPPDVPARSYDVAERVAARDAIRRKLVREPPPKRPSERETPARKSRKPR